MVVLETATKHYILLGQRMPIELTFYDNGYGCEVIARHIATGVSVVTRIGESMDLIITRHMEKVLAKGAKPLWVVCEMPDGEMMFAVEV